MARQNKLLSELAAMIDCSAVTAGRRVSGSIPFSLDELSLVAGWLGVPVTNFVGEIAAEPARAAS